MKVSDMSSSSRLRSIARPRQIAMYLSKTLTPKSLADIGAKFGKKDHTTVMHAIKKIEELRNLLKKYHLEKKILISVDGGVSDQNAKALTEAGARCLVTGSYFYNAKDRKQSVAALKQYSL